MARKRWFEVPIRQDGHVQRPARIGSILERVQRLARADHVASAASAGKRKKWFEHTPRRQS
ncbi:MAG: hypothetical protein M3077_10390 [Candidatus Dormibacteraeota bacterium]|nr:hypothetical protein [Candidatus Dormibacteraeota bacterium]